MKKLGIRKRISAESSWEPIYRQVKLIPRGRVITYGELSRMTRVRGGARAAGYAMAACPRGRGIPWYRVLGAGGRILLREPVAALQRKLLESEGVQFIGNRVDMNLHAFAKPRRNKPRSRPSY
jgi:methylated-DNA-protein-cysteine methyltransferase-like protein